MRLYLISLKGCIRARCDDSQVPEFRLHYGLDNVPPDENVKNVNRIDEYNSRRAHEAERKRALRRRHIKDKEKYKRKLRNEGRCRNPRCESPLGTKIEGHHLVFRSKFGKRNEEVHSRDNLVPLCHDCHQSLHTGKRPLTQDDLSVSEIDFIIKHAGKSWLNNYYPK